LLILLFNIQELIDKASSILVGNRSMLQRMQASVGISMTSSSEDPAYSSFNQVSLPCSIVWLGLLGYLAFSAGDRVL